MKIQYNGEKITLVRLVNNGDKEVVKSGQILDVSDERGKELLKYSSEFQLIGGESIEAAKEPKESKKKLDK